MNKFQKGFAKGTKVVEKSITSIIFRAIGIFLLPFGTALSIAYLAYAIPARKQPQDLYSKPLGMAITGKNE